MSAIGHRVPVGVDADIALDVDDALMEQVHLGHEERQRVQVRAFERKELARTGVQMALRRGVDLVAETRAAW